MTKKEKEKESLVQALADKYRFSNISPFFEPMRIYSNLQVASSIAGLFVQTPGAEALRSWTLCKLLSKVCKET